MRTRMRLVCMLAASSALVYACGGDDVAMQDGGTDGTVNDTGSTKDASGNDVTASDTGTTDTGPGDSGQIDSGSDSATDSGSSDSGSSDSGLEGGKGPFQCKTPSDCPGEFCCGTVVFNGGMIPTCTLEDASSACSSTCNSNISVTSCMTTDTLRVCGAKNDCLDAGTNYTQCCTVPIADASATFCWNSTYAGFAGGTCM